MDDGQCASDQAGGDSVGAASACRKSSPAAIFSDRTRFPCAFSAAGETRRETLLRKASESTAHVAGFGIQLGGNGGQRQPSGLLPPKVAKRPEGVNRNERWARPAPAATIEVAGLRPSEPP